MSNEISNNRLKQGGNMIKVIDSIMGSGKTTWAINEICNNTNKKYIYITPYLDEITRMKNETKNHNKMYEPNVYNNTTKKTHFHKLLSEGKNICSTHSLFTKADNTTRQALSANGYVLILDEVMDVVSELDNFTHKDLQMLQTLGLVYIENDFLIWNEDKDEEYDNITFRYADIKNMCNNKNLVIINNKAIYWNFPVDIFGYFEEVYILTYSFRAQIQRYYYDFHNIAYEYYQIVNNELKEYSVPLAKERVTSIKPLIDIYNGKYNNIGNDEHALSLNWFKNDISDDRVLINILQQNLYNWFNNANRGSGNKEKLWCTFKNAKAELQGKGYTKRFLPMNMRATNEYRETNVLSYCCNRFMKPEILNFFRNRNIEIDENLWATTELIQWIWRSRIRENEKISIYIPSKRMRDNLERFLNNDDEFYDFTT